MIPYNFHTHTTRCHHATGTEEEYILAAIEAGIEELGFSDHTPIPFKSGYVSGIRMLVEEAEEYVSVIRALGEKYKEQIKIYVGFECEYVPEFFEEQMALFDSLEVDYLIMGEHFVENEEYGRYSGDEIFDREHLARYVDTILEGASTGRYLYIAHPDIINFLGPENIYDEEITRLLEGLKRYKVPVEVNALGLFCNKQYPKPSFWDMVAKVGNEAVIGMDAHDPDFIKNQGIYDQCLEILESRGIQLVRPNLH